MHYEVGFGIRIIRDIAEVWVPLAVSKEIGDQLDLNSIDLVLFIVSDGQPAEDFTGYYIDNGIPSSALVDSYYGIMENVATIAKHLRSKGIKLFSASIDSAAVEPCNKIYGKENNVEVKEVRQLVDMVMRSLN